MSEDRELNCKQCGDPFVFTAGEQDFFQERGFVPPKRCPDCRKARKNRPGGQGKKEKGGFDVICSACGVATTVPFKPSTDRPVYCATCFRNR